MQNVYIRNIAMDIVLTLVTCGLYNLFVQYKQIEAVNAMLGEQKYDFVKWFLLTLVTCGLFHIYHEYKKSMDIATICGLSDNEAIINVVLTIFGLSIVADAIQQSHINAHYGNSEV